MQIKIFSSDPELSITKRAVDLCKEFIFSIHSTQNDAKDLLVHLSWWADSSSVRLLPDETIIFNSLSNLEKDTFLLNKRKDATPIQSFVGIGAIDPKNTSSSIVKCCGLSIVFDVDSFKRYFNHGKLIIDANNDGKLVLSHQGGPEATPGRQ